MVPDRRQFLATGIGAVLFCPAPGVSLERARAAISRGELGEVRFCRIFSNRRTMGKDLRSVEFALDYRAPRSISTQGNGRMATIRYARCIVSYESRPDLANAITFHGVRATLRVPL